MCGPKLSCEVIDLSYLIDDEDTPEDEVEMELRLENVPCSAPADETADETVDDTPTAPTVDQEMEESTFNIYDFLFLVEAKRNFSIAWALNRSVRVAAANSQLLMPNHDMMMMEEERRREQANNDLLDFFATLSLDFETNHTYTEPRYMSHFTGSETFEGSTLPTSIW